MNPEKLESGANTVINTEKGFPHDKVTVSAPCESGIINGQMEHWQRMGTTTSVSSVVYSGASWKYFADGWQAYMSAGGTGEGTVSQNTITVENGVLHKCFNWVQGIAATGGVYLRQNTAGHQYRGKTVIGSVYFKDVNSDGGFNLQISDGITTETVPLSTTGRYHIKLDCAVDYSDDGLYIGIQCGGNNTFTMQLADVSVYESEEPAPVRIKSYNEELRACQFRCWKSNPDWNPLVSSTQGRPVYIDNIRNTSGAYTDRWKIDVTTPVTMRSLPTLTFYPGRPSVGVEGQFTYYNLDTLVDLKSAFTIVTQREGIHYYIDTATTETVPILTLMVLLEADI